MNNNFLEYKYLKYKSKYQQLTGGVVRKNFINTRNQRVYVKKFDNVQDLLALRGDMSIPYGTCMIFQTAMQSGVIDKILMKENPANILIPPDFFQKFQKDTQYYVSNQNDCK